MSEMNWAVGPTAASIRSSTVVLCVWAKRELQAPKLSAADSKILFMYEVMLISLMLNIPFSAAKVKSEVILPMSVQYFSLKV
ncbi:hypothetical protein GCM10028895_40590 [Pontibacter rugosus]